MSAAHVEVWLDDLTLEWGIQCFDCGLDESVSSSAGLAFAAQEAHRCAVVRSSAQPGCSPGRDESGDGSVTPPVPTPSGDAFCGCGHDRSAHEPVACFPTCCLGVNGDQPCWCTEYDPDPIALTDTTVVASAASSPSGAGTEAVTPSPAAASTDAPAPNPKGAK